MDLSSNQRSLVTQLMVERFNFVYGDGHGVAYLLDPRFGGSGMDEDATSNVEAFISKWHGGDAEESILVELSRYRAMVASLQGSRRLELLQRGRISVDFWAGLDGYPLLKQVATRAFACGVSSAACKRNFSTHKFIHSSLRNRLKPRSVDMLVHLFFNAKNVQQDELEFLDEMMPEREDPEPDTPHRDDYIYY